MKILVVAATWMEVKLLADEFQFIGEKNHLLKEYQFADSEINILVTGIGTTFTTFHLTTTLCENNYDLVLNVGISGSLTRDLNIGEVVNVVTEEFADLGIEKNEKFLTLFESGYVDGNEFPFENGILKASEVNGLFNFSKVRGITSNKSHSRQDSITELNEKFSAHVVSMEGAAVFFVCSWLGIQCYQIRAISNYVNPNVMSDWNIPLALEHLKRSVIEILRKIEVPIQ